MTTAASPDHIPETTHFALPKGATALAKAGLTRGGLLRYRADWISVLVVLLALAVQFAAYLTAAPWWVAFAVVATMRWLHLVEHNHAHLPLFHARWLNEASGWLMFLNCGSPLDMYREQHVRVHHVHTQGPQDITSPFSYPGAAYPDRPTNYLWYLLTYAPRTWAHCLRVFLQNPKSRLARQFWASAAFVLVVSAGLAYYDLRSFVLFYVVAWVACYIGVPVNNWDHHLDCDVSSPYTAANTDLRPMCTWLGFNIGYHAAHTWYPGLHWTKLGEFHDRFMAEHTPAENYRPLPPP